MDLTCDVSFYKNDISKYSNVRLSFVDLRWAQLNFSLVFVTFFKLVLTWDLTIFGNTIGNKDRGEVIARTWFHSFFSRKKSEIRIAFTFFEKWKVKNKIPSLFFEKWKWNWNGSRSRTRSEKKFSRILEKRESRWSLAHMCSSLHSQTRCLLEYQWTKE